MVSKEHKNIESFTTSSGHRKKFDVSFEADNLKDFCWGIHWKHRISACIRLGSEKTFCVCFVCCSISTDTADSRIYLKSSKNSHGNFCLSVLLNYDISVQIRAKTTLDLSKLSKRTYHFTIEHACHIPVN